MELATLDAHDRDRTEAFVELLTLHQRRLYGFIYTLVPSQADAEDLLQQTSLILWRKFEEFDLGSDFAAWACRIARFEVLNHLKQKRRSRVVFNDELIARLAEIRNDRATVHSSDRVALTDCVEKLPENDRKLIKLCYGSSSNIKAAAEALRRPAASVYTSLVRVRRALMDCIRRVDVEEGRQ